MNRVAVLLASFNGESYISDQLDSIFKNTGFDIHVFVSDDGSTDSTRDVIESYTGGSVSLIKGPKAGCAGRNFYHLMKHVEWDRFDYISLADQDDLWLNDKLHKSIEALTIGGADAVSSDVEAFWPDGRTARIKKSYNQVKYDHFFEAGGPGCTYVFTLSTAKILRTFLNENWNTISQVKSHDWLFYAIVRNSGLRWKILPCVTMRYRQHEQNVAGVNQGVYAAFKRARAAKNGWYANDMNSILDLFKHPPYIGAAAKHKGYMLLVRLILNSGQLRRKPIEKVLIVPVLLLIYTSQLFS